MLLCDSCNHGHHVYCLKPKLKVSSTANRCIGCRHFSFIFQAIPPGNWYCDKCLKQKEMEEKLKSPEPVKKRRRIFREEEIEEEEEEQNEEEEEEVEEEQEEEAEAEESDDEPHQNG